MNKFLSLKLKFASLDWTFYGTWINLLMKHKFINFYWIVNNLIVRNNYLSLTKESIQKQLLTEQMFFDIDVLKNFAIFRRRKTKVESVFNKVAGLQLSCEYCEIFKSSFFIKHIRWLLLKNLWISQESMGGVGVIDLSL